MAVCYSQPVLTQVALAVALLAPKAQAQMNSAQPPTDPSQMSLAERAAAARKAAAERKAGHAEASRPDAPPPLTPEQRGSVQGNQYVNDFLQFRIDLGEWEPLTADRVATSEAMARKYVDPKASSSPYRVLWVGDRAGRNVSLSIIALPPDAPREVDQLAAGMKKVAFAQLANIPDLHDYKETALLGDSAHKFAAFRVAGTVKDVQIVQSEQVGLVNGFLLLFTLTGRSDQDVSEALQSFKTSFVFTAAAR